MRRRTRLNWGAILTCLLGVVLAPVPVRGEGAPIEGIEWQLAWYEAADGSRVAPLPDVAITVSLDGSNYFGSAGCNIYRGSYLADDSNLSLGPAAVTRRACQPAALMTQEHTYLARLSGTARYEATDLELLLLDATEVPRLGFVRETDAVYERSAGAWTVPGDAGRPGLARRVERCPMPSPS